MKALVLGMLGAAMLMPRPGMAAPIELQWQDLMPEQVELVPGEPLGGVVLHGEMTPVPETFEEVALVSAYNGR
jgi:hypothetical protein